MKRFIKPDKRGAEYCDDDVNDTASDTRVDTPRVDDDLVSHEPDHAASTTSSKPSAPAKKSDLPAGYERRNDGIVCFVVVDPNTGNKILAPLSRTPVNTPWLARIENDQLQLRFRARVGDRYRWVFIEEADLDGDRKLRAILQRQNVSVPPGKQALNLISGFFMAWVDELKAANRIKPGQLPDTTVAKLAGAPPEPVYDAPGIPTLKATRSVATLKAALDEKGLPMAVALADPRVMPHGGYATTYSNTKAALAAIGDFYRDAFHGRNLTYSKDLGTLSGELSDAATARYRGLICEHFGFDPGNVMVNDAAVELCNENSFDPIVGYLNSLKWDGKPRLHRWLATYGGAEDNLFNRVAGRLILTAAVRRARHPGSKFDHVLVFVGGEDQGKSTAVSILAGDVNFSDQEILTLSEQKQQELLCGKWLYELAELAGLKKADSENVKSFITRRVDRGRPAYGRHVVDQPRRCVFFGSTNEDHFLRSTTGNRRFWPVRVEKFDLDRLKGDRDLLWAEAAYYESKGYPLILPKRLHDDAKTVQSQHAASAVDPWVDVLSRHSCVAVAVGGRVTNDALFCAVGIEAKDRTPPQASRLAGVMKELGFERAKTPFRVNGANQRGFMKVR